MPSCIYELFALPEHKWQGGTAVNAVGLDMWAGDGKRGSPMPCSGVNPHLPVTPKLLKSPTCTGQQCPDQESAGLESGCDLSCL